MDVSIKNFSFQRKKANKWKILIAFFIIHALIPTTFCTYGVYILCFEDLGIPVSETISTPTVFIVLWITSKPIFRQITELWVENGKKFGRLWTSIATLIASLGVYMYSYQAFWCKIISGVFTGLSTSFIIEYARSTIYDNFQAHSTLIIVMEQSAIAINQFILPPLIYALISYYSLSLAPIVQCTILIQALPSVILLKNFRSGLPPQISRYSDFQRPITLLSSQEMVDFKQLKVTVNRETQATLAPDLEKQSNKTFRQWKSLPNIANPMTLFNAPTTVVDIKTNENNSDEDVDEIDSNINSRRKNSCGVEILPEIPEENEESILSDTNSYNSNINRLSMISSKLDEMISKQDANDVYITEKDAVHMLSNETELMSDSKNYSSVNKTNYCLSSYKQYRLKTYTRTVIKCFNEWCVKPSKETFTVYNFYLALLSSICVNLGWLVFLCIVPVYSKSVDYSLSQHDSVFIISVASFLWIAFLITTPWCSELPKQHFKYILIFSLFALSVAFYLFSVSSTHEIITSGSIVYGFGFGGASFTLSISNKNLLGPHKWPVTEKMLYYLTGLIIAIIMLFIRSSLNTSMGIAFFLRSISILQLITGLIWTSSVIFYKITSRSRYRNLQFFNKI